MNLEKYKDSPHSCMIATHDMLERGFEGLPIATGL